MAELVLCLGFFIIYFIEALVHRIFGLDSHGGHSHNHGHVPNAQNNKNAKTEVENGGFLFKNLRENATFSLLPVLEIVLNKKFQRNASKICHILFIRKPIVAISIFHFVLLYFFL